MQITDHKTRWAVEWMYLIKDHMGQKLMEMIDP